MELNEHMNNHEHASTSMKIVLLVFCIVLIAALGYFVAAVNNAPDTTDYSAPSVKKQATTETGAETVSALKCEDVKTGEKNYTSTKQGFCFNYPTAWILTDEAGKDNKIVWHVGVTDKIVPDSDYPGQLHVYTFKNYSDLDSKSLGATSLKDYLDKAAAQTEPEYQKVQATKVGGLDGFMAEAGPNSFGGGTFYFAELADKTVVKIWVAYDNTETANIIKSLKLRS